MKEENELMLKPCPVCGANAFIPPQFRTKFRGIVMCSNCGLHSQRFETEEEAIAHWNNMPRGESWSEDECRNGRERFQPDTSRIASADNSKDEFEELVRAVKAQERIESAKSLNKMWNGKKRNCDVYVEGRDALMDFMIANPKYGKPDGRMSYFTPFFAFVEWLWSPYEGDKVKDVKEALGEKQ